MEDPEGNEINEDQELPDIMKKFFPIPLNSPSQTDVLQDLYNPENIELKTRIIDVVGMSRLLTYAEMLENIGLTKSSATVLSFATNFMNLMVSKDGLGREEAIKAIIGMRVNDISDTPKVIDDLKSEK